MLRFLTHGGMLVMTKRHWKDPKCKKTLQIIQTMKYMKESMRKTNRKQSNTKLW